MVSAKIVAVRSFLPTKELTNEQLSEEFPEWSVEKIADKTGIFSRRISSDTEFSSDLAVGAGRRLLEDLNLDPKTIDYLILCTQTPDYILPSTACIVQHQLGLPTTSGATDITLGCSGYVYGLGLAKGLIESGQAGHVLLLTADTYTKLLNSGDKSVRTIFGDGASATLISGTGDSRSIHALKYGTDGSGAGALIVPNGGLRKGVGLSPQASPEQRGIHPQGYDLFMNGPEIFNFTIREVPNIFNSVLAASGMTADDIDFFVFHQANKFMLNHLRKTLQIPESKFIFALEETGNTVSSTIPIAIQALDNERNFQPGSKIMILGFGVGLSWAGAILEWDTLPNLK